MKGTGTPNISLHPVAAPGRTYLVIGPYCWGRDPNPTRALALASGNFSRSLFKPNYRPQYELLDVPLGTYVNDFGGFVMSECAEGDRTWTWLGAYRAGKQRVESAVNPFKRESK